MPYVSVYFIEFWERNMDKEINNGVEIYKATQYDNTSLVGEKHFL